MPTLAATSGRRESNPRPRAWKARALPTELLPRRIVSPFDPRSWRGEDSNLRRRLPADLQSAPFGRSGTSPFVPSPTPSRWPESNRRPADYKSAALPTELHRRTTRAGPLLCELWLSPPRPTRHRSERSWREDTLTDVD